MALMLLLVFNVAYNNKTSAATPASKGYLHQMVEQLHFHIVKKVAKAKALEERTFLAAPCIVAPDAIGGMVYVDTDVDGIKDAHETTGLEGVIIELYDCNGSLSGVTTSDVNGEWTLSGLTFGGATDFYRLEYTLSPAQLAAGYQPSFNTGSNVQFINASGCTYNFGIMDAPVYTEQSPHFAINCYVEGSNVGSNEDVLISLNHRGATNVLHESRGQEIGTTFGLAYQKTSGNLFAAAYQKRFSGYGGGTPGSIYIISSPADNVYSGSLFVDLNTLFGSNVAGADPHDFVTTGVTGDILDAASFDAVGRVGFGDMDISEDQLSLWTINLNDRSLYRIPLGPDPTNPTPPATSGDVDVFPLADPGNPLPGLPAGITNDEIIPFATKCKKGLVYIGVVTNGQDGGPLRALIYSFDTGTTSFSKVLEFDLNYRRGCGFGQTSGCFGPADWNSWTKTNVFPTPTVLGFSEVGYPQPILTDIEFDAAGNMIIGMRDRIGDQGGFDVPTPEDDFYKNKSGGSAGFRLGRTDAFGDVLRATKTGPGTFSINIADFEDLSDSPASSGSGIQPCPPSESVFGEDCYNADGYNHEETTMGGLAVHLGYNDMVVCSMDPLRNPFSNGVDWYDLGNATLDRSFEVLTVGINSDFGKSYGLGDVEMLSSQAPVQVGNLVWLDTDNDGVQDPCETGVPNLNVRLYKDDGVSLTQIAETITNVDGQYLFTDYEEYGSGFDTLTPGMDYLLVFGEGGSYDTGLGIFTVGGDPFQVANLNTGEGSNAELNDSDGTAMPIAGNYPAIAFTMTAAGTVNHNFDLGLAPVYDFGDLPDSYATSSGQNGPAHALTNDLYLGDCADAEMDGQPEAMAGSMMDGDDNNFSGITVGTCSGNDDEDGIELLTPLIPGSTACVLVTSHNNTGDKAFLSGWIDFNGDGSFQAGEQLLFDQMMPPVADAEVPVGDNTLPYCFEVPSSAVFASGNAFMRFRLSTSTGLSYDSLAPDGEVEDYKFALAKVGNYVWTDEDYNGLQDETATGINGAEITLTWAGPDDDINTLPDNVNYITNSSTMGGIDGGYMFSGLIAGTYRLAVTNNPLGTSPSLINDPGASFDTDSEDPSGVDFTITDTEALPIGENGIADMNGASGFPDNQEDLSFDFGFAPPCSMTLDNYEVSECDDNRYTLTVTLTYEGITGDIEILVDGQPFYFTPSGLNGTTSFTVEKLTCFPNVQLPINISSVDDPTCFVGPPFTITTPCPDQACKSVSATRN